MFATSGPEIIKDTNTFRELDRRKWFKFGRFKGITCPRPEDTIPSQASSNAIEFHDNLYICSSPSKEDLTPPANGISETPSMIYLAGQPLSLAKRLSICTYMLVQTAVNTTRVPNPSQLVDRKSNFVQRLHH
jgi:hypothetical protein